MIKIYRPGPTLQLLISNEFQLFWATFSLTQGQCCKNFMCANYSRCKIGCNLILGFTSKRTSFGYCRLFFTTVSYGCNFYMIGLGHITLLFFINRSVENIFVLKVV
jgi:hypothetical protein